MSDFILGDTLEFDDKDNRPKAVVVGIDLYQEFKSNSGKIQNWESFTLEAIENVGNIKLGEKFYAVALPEHGLCLVEEIKRDDLPTNLPDEDSDLSGEGIAISTGSAVQGTGKNTTQLTTWYNQEKDDKWEMFATETFNNDEGERMFFRTTPLKGPAVAV